MAAEQGAASVRWWTRRRRRKALKAVVSIRMQPEGIDEAELIRQMGRRS